MELVDFEDVEVVAAARAGGEEQNEEMRQKHAMVTRNLGGMDDRIAPLGGSRAPAA
jgi:hypothetical protein